MLYLHKARYRASPKAISGRTSYLRVRLEFLPYPQLITTLFNGCVFGPPLPFTAASSCPWVDHPVSGLCMPTFALFTLGFPSARYLKYLTSPAYNTLTCFSSLQAQGFRFSFTPLPGSFSPFPHGTILYRSLSSI